ncbi:hypothetical protein [Marinospirillum alkaliphilum]|uniref:DUF2946 domain-containing protein n=1 Tax=Marinospirillum alkaliphilum DSM 21637 TaxID=1122209 RepID=A0A1K1V243_9GAMM|nr:hypothetical protein [Marinospirillum alkaliphilum]SFX19209.1 hypothetical protein SAMN02745752_00740 [Marinospirillum alkaliphilum DSM 21637]
MSLNLTRLHAHRRITGSLLLLVFVLGLLLPVSALAVPLHASAASQQMQVVPCNEKVMDSSVESSAASLPGMSHSSHHGLHAASVTGDAAEDNCHEMRCTQCSYCSLLISRNTSDLQLLVETPVLAATGLAFTLTSRLDRPPKNPLI